LADQQLESVLRAGLEQLRLPVEDSVVQKLLGYLGQLERWNGTYNLTAIRDPGEMVTKHILDSLSVLPWAPSGTLLDAGAGAGLPGIPLAIANSSLQVTLVDSAGKKVRFMNHVRRNLGLDNVHPVQARVEEMAAGAPFDLVVSRAFTSIAAFLASVRHLADGATRLLVMKGRYPEAEITELPDWAEVSSVEKLSVPGLHENRHLVIMSVNP
jgi:16S rRNA (guanine527-N7)-methyltransferase